jgi:tetratricopeptide (TPR) repeat protein
MAMTCLRAFVGHSFNPADKHLVQTFLDYFESLGEILPDFSWQHAEHAEPTVLAEKVMRLLEGKNLFIGICTKNEQVVISDAKNTSILGGVFFTNKARSFKWKTSDWIIQEIGLALGRKIYVVLLVENGVRPPGGLQGNLEYIAFDRSEPEKCFMKILQMLSAISPNEKLTTEPELEAKASVAKNPETEVSQDDGDWYTPRPGWDRSAYEVSFMYALIKDKNDKAKEISKAYLLSEEGQIEENRITWKGFEELEQIRYGKIGKISTLKAMIDDHPTSSKLLEYIAESYSAFNEHEMAASFLKKAAALVTEEVQKFKLHKAAVTALQKAGNHTEAAAIVHEMRQSWDGTEVCEAEILIAERIILESEDNFEFQVGSMERQLELYPNDSDLRFELAYKYSQAEEHGLSAMHYLRIPFGKRTAVAWNNLGVAYNKLRMQAKSIEAYRRSEKMGETLAMSNLANRMLDVGFIPEAKQICETAAKIDNYHENIGHSMSRLKELPQEEEKEEIEMLKKAQSVCDFYREFGKGLAKNLVYPLANRWKGKHCEMALVFDTGTLNLSGKFERNNAMNFGMHSIFNVYGKSADTPAITKHTIEYSGTVKGRAVVGWVSRDRENEPDRTSTLLTKEDDRTLMLMVFSEDGREIRVIEKPKTGIPQFYTLRAICTEQGQL